MATRDAPHKENNKATRVNRVNKAYSLEEELFRLPVAELAAVPPPTPEEEKRMLHEMVDGRRAIARLKADKKADESKKLGKEEKARLKEIIEKGRESRKKLIEANGRLVISIAARYQGHGLSLAELSQEGVLGLIRALDKFDVTKGVRLSTYASYWIRQSVSRAVAVQTRTIRLPVHKVDKLARVRRASGQLTQELGREPNVDEIAEAIDSTTENVQDLIRHGQEILSLEQPVGDDGANVGDFIESQDMSPIEESVDINLLSREISDVLESLSARESRIVEMRFGLRDGNPLTLQDVAERFGLTRERIRQIEKEALAKLRRPEASSRLAVFLN